MYQYRSSSWVPITSNMCERLFSRANIIFDERRQRMLPINLEILLFLKLHRSLWDKYYINTIYKTNHTRKSPVLFMEDE